MIDVLSDSNCKIANKISPLHDFVRQNCTDLKNGELVGCYAFYFDEVIKVQNVNGFYNITSNKNESIVRDVTKAFCVIYQPDCLGEVNGIN